jgi:uncharacterized protein (TIGR03437 family)
MKLMRTVSFLFAALSLPAGAQVFDSSGNGMLNGKYYFREVLFTATDEVAMYGNITFSSGTYTISGTQTYDCNQSGCGFFNPPAGGTYSIAASGFGFISNQLLGGQIYGLVGGNGVFVGSSTETGNYDLFIAAPVTSQSASTLQGPYSLAFIDVTGAATGGTPIDAQLQMSPNGAGTIGNVSVSAYVTTSTPITQTLSGVKYIVSNNAFVVTFPNSSTALLTGNEYLYSTPDGSFVFGGSPQSFDMIVGVRTGGSTSGLGGLYYTAGFDADNSSGNIDTFYGSLSANAGSIIGHERLQFGGLAAEDFTFYASYKTGSSTYTDSNTNTQYTIGTSGVRIGLGIGPSLGVTVALQAPNLTGTGVFLSPVGVVNSASSAPFTAGVSRGELLTLVGTNLGPSTLQVASSLPFPTILGGVQVMINNVPAPIYYVSATQLSAIVPFETTASIAQIQVINNGTASNVVTEFLNATNPGIFTNPAGGIGYAAALHADFSLVTPAHPAQIGEVIAVFVTGLGDVSPTIADGAAGVFSTTNNTITADVSGTAAAVSYAGLAPGLAGLYQLNIQIPTGVTAGDNYLNIGTMDATSYSSEALISVAAASTSAGPQARPALRRPASASRLFPWGRRPQSLPQKP